MRCQISSYLPRSCSKNPRAARGQFWVQIRSMLCPTHQQAGASQTFWVRTTSRHNQSHQKIFILKPSQLQHKILPQNLFQKKLRSSLKTTEWVGEYSKKDEWGYQMSIVLGKSSIQSISKTTKNYWVVCDQMGLRRLRTRSSLMTKPFLQLVCSSFRMLNLPRRLDTYRAKTAPPNYLVQIRAWRINLIAKNPVCCSGGWEVLLLVIRRTRNTLTTWMAQSKSLDRQLSFLTIRLVYRRMLTKEPINKSKPKKYLAILRCSRHKLVTWLPKARW